MRRWLRYPAALTLLAFLAGCTSPQPMVAAQVISDVDLDSFETYYVPQHEGDRGVGKFIVEQLVERGKEVRVGSAPQAPEGTDVLVVYEDSWMWDLTMYLILLRIDFRDPETHVLLAAGSSSRPSVIRAAPHEMVRETLDGIFAGGVLAYPDLVIEEEE